MTVLSLDTSAESNKLTRACHQECKLANETITAHLDTVAVILCCNAVKAKY